jgi:hypothetical protein
MPFSADVELAAEARGTTPATPDGTVMHKMNRRASGLGSRTVGRCDRLR